jgi:hypothetical protein
MQERFLTIGDPYGATRVPLIANVDAVRCARVLESEGFDRAADFLRRVYKPVFPGNLAPALDEDHD